MMSVLTLALMVVLVASMRQGGARAAKFREQQAKGRSRVVLGPGIRLVRRKHDPKNPDTVSYALFNDGRLPSPAQRAMRRAFRPFDRAGRWAYRLIVRPKHDVPTADGPRTQRQSAELQNFLDARNREIARRKADGQNKPGPDDRLH